MNWFKKPREKNILDGMTRYQAKKKINNIIPHDEIKGIFSDEDWAGINKIFKAFTNAGLDWSISNSRYIQDDRTDKYIRKEWSINVYFNNSKGQEDIISFKVTAYGAGSVEYPLERYDITAYVM